MSRFTDDSGPPVQLHLCAKVACREEPTLRSAGEGHLVTIPRRVIRQAGRQQAPGAAPPLIRMLDVGRQSAEVRVRAYLWLWAIESVSAVSRSERHRTTGEWAVLLNLIDDDATHDQAQRSLAARRVSRALQYLEAQQLIARPQRDVVRILDSPGIDPDEPCEGEALPIPTTLWTNGTVSALSAAALAVLLVLWAYETDSGAIIDMPKNRPYHYPITHSTWHRGTTELETAGLTHRERGRLVFPATNANPTITTDRYKARWVIHHQALRDGPPFH